MKKEIICIACPMGCRMTAEQDEDGGIRVAGNGCKRGEAHAKAELIRPMRRLTTTVKISGAALPRLPVISDGEVPKGKIGDCLKVLYAMEVAAPVACGQIIAENICGLGVAIIASRSMKKE